MISITEIKGAIFDCDGTLLDSMELWGRVEIEYLISLGAAPRPGLSDDLRTLGGLEVPMYLRAEYGIQKSVSEINAGINARIEDFYMYQVPLKAGVADVLQALHVRGVKMCVATATDRYLVEAALRRCGVLGYFERVFSCGEEETSKSSPDIYIRAADFLKTGIADTLVFEDALYAMQSAKNAGFPVAAVHDPSSDDQRDEIMELCDFYYMSIDEMLSDLD